MIKLKRGFHWKILLISLLSLNLISSYSYAICTNGFDFPVGDPSNHKGWYVSLSLGASWNCSPGNCAGHMAEDFATDTGDALGKAVYSIANGVVYTTLHPGFPNEDPTSTWGGVVIIKHEAPPGKTFDITGCTLANDSNENNSSIPIIYSMYAHLKNITVIPGQTIKKGKKLGEIADINAWDLHHLHFEIKNQSAIDSQAYNGVGSGYSGTNGVAPDHYLPSKFINLNRNVYANRVNTTWHPNGTLIKGSGPKVYLLEGGKKRHVLNPDVLRSWYRSRVIIEVPDNEIAAYQDGTSLSKLRDGALIKGSGNAVYIVTDNGQRRAFSSAAVFNSLGYQWDKIITISDSDINTYATGSSISSTDKHPNGTLVQGEGDPKVYLLDNGNKGWIRSPEVMHANCWTWDDIIKISANELNSYGTGNPIIFRDGTLIRGTDKKVYVIEDAQKRHITSEQIFLELGYSGRDIIDVPDESLLWHQTGKPIERLEPSLTSDPGCAISIAQGAPTTNIKDKFIAAYNTSGASVLRCPTSTVTQFTNSFYSPSISGYYQDFQGNTAGQKAAINFVTGYPAANDIKYGFYETFKSLDEGYKASDGTILWPGTNQPVSNLLVSPTGFQQPSPSPSKSGTAYTWQPFIKGSMYFFDSSPILNGAFNRSITYVWGDLSDRYQREGGAKGLLGLPLLNEFHDNPSGGWDWWYQWFERGAILYAKKNDSKWSYAFKYTGTDIFQSGDWVGLGWCQHFGGGAMNCSSAASTQQAVQSARSTSSSASRSMLSLPTIPSLPTISSPPQYSFINASVDHSSINFGNILIGQTSDQTITISNQSTSTGDLSGNIGALSNPFSVVSGEGSFNLRPGDSRNVTIRFSPASQSYSAGALSISHNGTNQITPLKISIDGTGIVSSPVDTTTHTLTVTSVNSGNAVTIIPNVNDNNGNGTGITPFTRIYNHNAQLTMTAPLTNGGLFQKWQLDGIDLSDSLTANVTMGANHTLTAIYAAQIVETGHTLTINSMNPNSGVGITIDQIDNKGELNGTTPFIRTYNNYIFVNLTAEKVVAGKVFQKWQRNGEDYSTNLSTDIVTSADYQITAVYTEPAEETKGDFNADKKITVEDTIIALKVMSGMSVSGLIYEFPKNDVDGVKGISLKEAIYALQRAANIRELNTTETFSVYAEPACNGTFAQIRLTWTIPPSGAESYTLYRNDTAIFSTYSATTYLDTVLPGDSYTYYVRASTYAGNRDSTTVFLTMSSCGASPPEKSTLTIIPECSNNKPQLRLSWTPSVGVDFYRIYRNGIPWEDLMQTTLLDTDVILGTNYSYYISAINSGGRTDSNEVAVTTTCITPPGAFTLTVTPWCDGINPQNIVEWTGSAGHTQPYEIYRNDTSIFTTELSSYSDTAVTAGTSYGYYVRAKNTEGSRDSNTVSVTTKNDCAATITPVIDSISPSSVTTGDDGFTLTIKGSNFDSTCKAFWEFSPDRYLLIYPTFVNSTEMTVNVTKNSSGYSPFSYPGNGMIRILKPYPDFATGPRSNAQPFTIFNPVPSINSISGTCQAKFNCVPSNGRDIRVNGSGFVTNSYNADKSSTTVTINGQSLNPFMMGQGPVYSQMQILINGSLIMTPGTYTIEACNEGTTNGRVCSTGSLTVIP